MIMAKAPINGILLLSQRSYKTVAEKAAAAAGAVIKKAVDEEEKKKKKAVFWMRDPKSGNWIPESHFHDVDVAELREKFLSKKKGKL